MHHRCMNENRPDSSWNFVYYSNSRLAYPQINFLNSGFLILSQSCDQGLSSFCCHWISAKLKYMLIRISHYKENSVDFYESKTWCLQNKLEETIAPAVNLTPRVLTLNHVLLLLISNMIHVPLEQ